MTPTFRLECQGCQRFLGGVPFPVICTGTTRWVPHVTVEGGTPLYLKCGKCGTCSRYEVVAPEIADALLRQAVQQAASNVAA